MPSFAESTPKRCKEMYPKSTVFISMTQHVIVLLTTHICSGITGLDQQSLSDASFLLFPFPPSQFFKVPSGVWMPMSLRTTASVPTDATSHPE